ncbi:MAG TPA: cation diffusion facilitator family transporter [Candidatus Polarisedimenticolia bacterium]|nr:cation diffusion facilitator family transporter [Dongiaceae bacterium]HYV88454.1 cation diffusion facilitator family transporter [Candidatus Polarisedimenticolia bacterium]
MTIAPSSSMAADNGRLMRLATYASVTVALCLITLKVVAYVMTDSVSMLSTLIDSLLDTVASVINLFAVRAALTPADKEHRFGHGKAEPLAAMGQSAFIGGSAVFLLVEAGNRLFNPSAIQNTGLGIIVMLISIAATIALVIFQRRVIQRTGSVAIKADSLHYLGDLFVNCAVIVSLLLWRQFGWSFIDPLFAVAIAAYILFTAWQVAQTSLDLLMDRELPDSARRKIRDIALAHREVRDIHDLRTRSSGQATFIQFHLELDGNTLLSRAHTVSDEVEDAILVAFPGAEVIIHQDPAGLVENRPRFA